MKYKCLNFELFFRINYNIFKIDFIIKKIIFKMFFMIGILCEEGEEDKKEAWVIDDTGYEMRANSKRRVSEK